MSRCKRCQHTKSVAARVHAALREALEQLASLELEGEWDALAMRKERPEAFETRRAILAATPSEIARALVELHEGDSGRSRSSSPEARSRRSQDPDARGPDRPECSATPTPPSPRSYGEACDPAPSEREERSRLFSEWILRQNLPEKRAKKYARLVQRHVLHGHPVRDNDVRNGAYSALKWHTKFEEARSATA